MKQNNKTLIIAEAGVNHNGDIKLAKKMITIAAESGVDLIKFQTFKSENIATKSAQKASYQTKNTNDKNNSQLKMLKKLELNEKQHLEIINYCNKCGIKFFSTGFDSDSLKMLSKFGLEQFKVPSGEINNLPYLKEIASFGKPIILSSGMSSLGEIEMAIEKLQKFGIERHLITVLHCNSDYPSKYSDVNLNAMVSIKQSLKVNVGYSDHTLGIEVPIAAVAMGAKIIEKHFTLDRNLPGPDHKASILPDELKAMVLSIRNIEKALGDGIKRPTQSELKNLKVVRKSIVARTNISKGEVFTEKNITVKRPGSGINPMMFEEIIGMKAKKSFLTDEMIEI